MKLQKCENVWRMLAKYCFEVWGLSGAKACKSCTSRQELSNEFLLAKFCFDTAENEPLKVCCWRMPRIWLLEGAAAPADADSWRGLEIRTLKRKSVSGKTSFQLQKYTAENQMSSVLVEKKYVLVARLLLTSSRAWRSACMSSWFRSDWTYAGANFAHHDYKLIKIDQNF